MLITLLAIYGALCLFISLIAFVILRIHNEGSWVGDDVFAALTAGAQIILLWWTTRGKTFWI